MDKTFKQFDAPVKKEIEEINFVKDDVILAGNGVFSFNKSEIINPEFKKVDENLDVDIAGINYILADYNAPAEENGWKKAVAEFDLSDAYREFYKYSFIISVPGLKSDDAINDYIEIKEIKIDLEGTSLIEKIKKLIQYSHAPNS